MSIAANALVNLFFFLKKTNMKFEKEKKQG